MPGWFLTDALPVISHRSGLWYKKTVRIPANRFPLIATRIPAHATKSYSFNHIKNSIFLSDTNRYQLRRTTKSK